jgi:integrase
MTSTQIETSAPESRPQLDSEPDLQLRERRDVRPAIARDELRDSCSVNASSLAHLAKRAAPHGLDEVQDSEPGHLGGLVIERHGRERLTELSWGEASWSRRHTASLATVIGASREGMSEASLSLICGSYHQCGEEARIRIYTYRPRLDPERWAEIETFVRDVVATAAPETAYTAHRLLVTVTHFVNWTRIAGLPLNAAVLFQRSSIEHYVRSNRKRLADGTLRNYRSMLLRVSEVLLPTQTPRPMTALNKRTGIAPYTTSEVESLKYWANGQRTEVMRRKARSMLCLCMGAGLRAIEVAAIRRSDVVVDGEGVLVIVHAPDGTRFVPMLAEWEPLLRQTVEGLASDDFLFGTADRTTYRNLIPNFVGRSIGDIRPQSNRLRATWVVTHLRMRSDMRALMEAAGVSKFENLARYLQYVPELDSTEYRLHLRAEARR